MGNMIFNRRIMESNEAPPHQYDFDKYGKEFVSEEKLATVERRIFAQHMYGGPKGLGDPTYRWILFRIKGKFRNIICFCF